MISEFLIPMLKEHFPGRGLVINDRPDPCAVFPAVHPEVGAIEIYDDVDEITINAGHFTHGDFSNYDQNLSDEQKHNEIANDVISFLDDLFADRVVLWGSHSRGGGWCYKDAEGSLPPNGERLYVWSGPLHDGGLTSRSS